MWIGQYHLAVTQPVVLNISILERDADGMARFRQRDQDGQSRPLDPFHYLERHARLLAAQTVEALRVSLDVRPN